MGTKIWPESGEEFAAQKMSIFVKNEGGDARCDARVAERAHPTQGAGVGDKRQGDDGYYAGRAGKVGVKYCAPA